MSNQRLTWAALILALLGLGLSVRQWVQSGSSSGVPRSRSDGTLAKVLQEKRLRVAYIHYPPSAFRDPTTRTVRGHFVDTLKEIMGQLDPTIEITYEETTWADFGAALNSGRVDLSIAGTFATIPRAKTVTFTRPLVYLGRSAIVRKGDTRFSSEMEPMQFDRPGIRIGVVDGEGSHEYVKNFKNQQSIVVFSGSDLSQCLVAVSSGQVDIGLSDALEVSKYAKAHPEVRDLFADRPYDLTPIAWAVRHDDFLWKSFLDTAIETLDTQGKLAGFERDYEYRWVHPVIEFRKR